MAKFIAAALLGCGILSSGCATVIAQACAGQPGSACRGSDAVIFASVLVIESAVDGNVETLPVPEDPRDPPGTRYPSK